jgi:hypothetical protein
MLGYDAQVHEILPGVSSEELGRIVQRPYEQRMDYLRTLTSRRVAHIPYRTWVDHLLVASREGRVQLLHDGGYPYLFRASGADIKLNFASEGVEAVSGLTDVTWYVVEAWDQS